MNLVKGFCFSLLFQVIYLSGRCRGNSNGDLVIHPKVICYFLHYTWYRDNIASFYPNNINASLCTHIVYSFAGLNRFNLTIESYDKWADIDNGFYKQVTDYKHDGVKVLLEVGGWDVSKGDTFSRLVSSQNVRMKFVYDTVCYLNKHGFQGLVINWEFPKCWQNDCESGPASDKTNFVFLIKELKEAFQWFDFELAILVPQWLNLIDEGFNIPVLSENLNWIGVKTYFTSPADSSTTEPDAPLYSTGSKPISADYFISELVVKGANPSKLMVGFPFFARTFTLSDDKLNGFGAPSSGPGIPGVYTKEAGRLAYFEVCSNILKNKWSTKSSEFNNSIAFRGNQWANYIGPADIARRVQFLKNAGYGGAFVWDLSQDDFINMCNHGVYPLLTALNNELYYS